MNFGINLWNKAVCRIHGLVVIEGMNLSGHPWIINEIQANTFHRSVNGKRMKIRSAPIILQDYFLSENVFKISRREKQNRMFTSLNK